MAEKKISELTAITSSELDDDDNLIIVDTSESQTKKISKSELASALVGGGDSSTLEGQDGAYYLNYNNHTNTPTIPTNNNQLTNGAGYITSADGGNATTLDSLDSTSFLRSDADDNKTSGNLTFEDNIKARFGTSGDLQIFHNGSNSIIAELGTGEFQLQTNGTSIKLVKANTSEILANFIPDGSVDLYHDASKKFSTSSTGAEITGDLTLTSTDDSATEDPTLDLYRNSASPANSDVLGHILFSGETSTGAKVQYAEIESRIVDVTNGSEDGRLVFRYLNNGLNPTVIDMSFGRIAVYQDIKLQVDQDLYFQGSTDDANETQLTVADPTADNIITLPDATGTVILDTGNQSITGDLTLTSTDSGSAEDPNLKLFRDSSSPATSDFIGTIQFQGKNNADETTTFAEIQSQISDVTDGTEDGVLYFTVRRNGTLTSIANVSGSSGRFNITNGNLFLQTGADLIFEGATNNNNETTLTVIDPTSDNTIQLPDSSGTVALDVITPLYADFYDSTTGTSIDSGAAVPWDATRNNSDATAISLSGSEITINQAGDFKIDFQVTVEFSDTGTERSDAVCYLEEYNGSTWSEIEGTRAAMYIRQDTFESTGAVSLIHTVTSGYKYRVFGTRQTGLGNLRFGQDSRITIVRLA